MINSEVAARELAETSTSVENTKTPETRTNGLGEAKYYGEYHRSDEPNRYQADPFPPQFPGGGPGGYP
ncbi:hypothetical protein ACH5RR_031918 [Cinchona calisaya]|uniref:Uncharacterized protein n=1 Tax=Cinchona calisaya TaxID=153742 RepID=A0ABD2YHZ4_9GENT